MLRFKALTPRIAMGVSLLLVSFLVGCAGQEVGSDGIWYPKELPDAGRAVEAARKGGKDKECPDDFKAAEKMKNDAYTIWRSCRTKEAIAMALDATKKANSLCPPKPVPPAPPPPPRAAAPTVSMSAAPESVLEGQCATLTWSSSNASSVSIDKGIGKVSGFGTRQVCPESSTSYSVTATGDGGSQSASATVTVRPKVVDRLTLHITFDFNKATIKSEEDADLQKAIDFAKKYPALKISLTGYTDNVGKPEYNQKLSERRAAAVKEYLVKHGVESSRIGTAGRGESDPVADNKTEKGRAENRRVEVQALSE